MWILITFAIIALVLFLGMTLLKVEPIISIVISVLAGLILAYFAHHLTITYSEDKYHMDMNFNDNKNNKNSASTNASINTSTSTNVPTTNIQSSNSNSATSSNSNTFGFFQTGK